MFSIKPSKLCIFFTFQLALFFLFNSGNILYAENTGSKKDAGASIYYTVKKGDTLWNLSGKFLDSRQLWPGFWSMNPSITNPHLIYPGRQIRLFSQVDTNRKSVVIDTDDKQMIDLKPSITAHLVPGQKYYMFTLPANPQSKKDLYLENCFAGIIKVGAKKENHFIVRVVKSQKTLKKGDHITLLPVDPCHNSVN